MPAYAPVDVHTVDKRPSDKRCLVAYGHYGDAAEVHIK